jgi:hypothetical protein
MMLKKQCFVFLLVIAISCLLPLAASAEFTATVPTSIPHLAPDGDGTVINVTFIGNKEIIKEALLHEGWSVDNSPFHHGDGLALQKNVQWVAGVPMVRDHINLWETNDPKYGLITYGNAHHDDSPRFPWLESHYVTDFDNTRNMVYWDFENGGEALYGMAFECYLNFNPAGYYQCDDPLLPGFQDIGRPYTNGKLAFLWFD